MFFRESFTFQRILCHLGIDVREVLENNIENKEFINESLLSQLANEFLE